MLTMMNSKLVLQWNVLARYQDLFFFTCVDIHQHTPVLSFYYRDAQWDIFQK